MAEADTKHLKLPQMPQGEYYEDFIAALLCVGGFYIEKRIEMSEPINILELDVVSTKLSADCINKTLIEIKSGQWGMPDVFKVRGWLDFLKYNNASFISLNASREQFEQRQQIAEELQIKLLNIDIDADGKIDAQSFKEAYGISIDKDEIFDCAVACLRYSLCLERTLIDKYLKPLTKSPDHSHTCSHIRDFIKIVTQHSFFLGNTNQRIQEVFESYIKYKNITARIDKMIREGGNFEEIAASAISSDTFRNIFYEINGGQKHYLHVALYSELICRLTIFKQCIEVMIDAEHESTLIKNAIKSALASNLRNAMTTLKEHTYFYLYPHFWQIFIFLFGGFILTDKKEDEYMLLSKFTGIPTSEIENALQAFDILFPLDRGGWLIPKPNTTITILQFMPLPFCGIGTNFRRMVYGKDSAATYENLEKQLTGKFTITDLIKYNNLTIEYLSMDTKLRN